MALIVNTNLKLTTHVSVWTPEKSPFNYRRIRRWGKVAEKIESRHVRLATGQYSQSRLWVCYKHILIWSFLLYFYQFLLFFKANLQFACNLHAICVQIACNLHATGVQIACKLHAINSGQPHYLWKWLILHVYSNLHVN